MRRVCLVVIGCVWWPCLGAWAGETSTTIGVRGPGINLSSLTSFQTTLPSSAQHLARPLHQAVETFDARGEAQRQVKQLRLQRDSISTELTALNSELEVVEGHEQQLAQQLTQTEERQVEQMGFLQTSLEARLKGELFRASQQIAEELRRDIDRQIQAFETRQRGAIGHGLELEFDLEERELDQLAQEIEVQTQELVNRLARLDASPGEAESLERSMRQALKRRKGALQARRKQLEAEREAAVTVQRDMFLARLKQQQEIALPRRMTMKEAALRQAMAELLHRTRTQLVGEVEYLRQAYDGVGRRHRELADRQVQLESRLLTVERELALQFDRAETLEDKWDSALDQVEMALEQTDLSTHPEVVGWFNETIRYLIPDLAADLRPLPQRALARAVQEQQLEEQRRLLRERHLATQLSREMAQQRHRMRLKQQREQEARSKQVDTLLTKAKQLAGRGAFDQALAAIAEAEALDPPQIARVMIAREEIITAKEGVLRKTKADELERLFSRAMNVFEQGRFEEAITLFEQVIVAEAKLGGPTRMIAGTMP